MASNLYTPSLLKIATNDLDFETDTIKALAVTSGYTFSKSHEFVSQITNEVSGTGYSRQTLSTKSIVSTTGTPDQIEFKDTGGVTFTNIDVSGSGDIAALIIYKEVTTDSDSPVICYVDIPDIATNGSTITIDFTNDIVFEIENTIN